MIRFPRRSIRGGPGRPPVHALDGPAPRADAWRMWRWLYQMLLVFAWPAVRLRLYWRARREPAYGERIAERYGRVPARVRRGAVWFHTVSAGETIAAAPLIGELAAAFPERPFLVTTMTPTGSAQVAARLGDRVDHCYAPYDFPWAVRRFFARTEPCLLILMETELWPNLIAEAARRGIPVSLVNARLSERSARGYRRLGALTRGMLERLRWVACQYPEHARRFAALGVPEDRLLVHGSVKFDVALPADHGARVRELRARWSLDNAPVWIAASTHPGEEAMALTVHQRLRGAHPDARLLLVPRHPTRAEAVLRACREAGFDAVCVSTPSAADTSASVILGDTMGELLYLYGAADLAFVGGSFFGRGGHNPIEPALCSVAAVMGPDVFNFSDVVAAFRAADALQLVADQAALGDAVCGAFDDIRGRRERGLRAHRVVAANTGARARLRALLAREIGAAAADGGAA